MSDHTSGPWEWDGNILLASPEVAVLREIHFHRVEDADKALIAAAPALADVWDNLSEELRAYILSEAPEWVGKSIRAWVGARTL